MKTREEEYCTLRDEAVKRGRTESGTPTRGRPTEQGLSLGSRAGGAERVMVVVSTERRERIPMMKGVKGLWSQTKASGSFSTGSPTLEFLASFFFLIFLINYRY